MEHVNPIGRDFPWRQAALPLALLVTITLAALAGRAFLHRLPGTRPEPGSGRVQKRQSSASLALRPRATTSVLVLNGNGSAGAAGSVSSRLLADGYRSAPSMNAQVTTYARSIVLFRPGWEREAKRLAKDARIRAVAPLDGPLPSGAAAAPLVAIVGR
jgi:LytR cell envelope-related transcriptional attenuator